MAVWIVGSPIAGQGFRIASPALPAWHMYRDWGTGILSVQLYVRGPDGDVAIDRLGTLGLDWRRARRERTLKSLGEFRAQARTICDALGPGTDLRADVDIGKVRGWVPLERRERNLCER